MPKIFSHLAFLSSQILNFTWKLNEKKIKDREDISLAKKAGENRQKNEMIKTNRETWYFDAKNYFFSAFKLIKAIKLILSSVF